MLSVSIDPHKLGVLREKNKFWDICEKHEFFEIHDLFLVCLPNQASKWENRIGNHLFKNRAVNHVPQVNIFKNTTI